MAPKIDLTLLEQKIHDLTNRQRVAYKLSVLNSNPSLASVARRHSEDMAEKKYFSHINLSGDDLSERGRKAGLNLKKKLGSYYFEGIGENIFQNNLYDRIMYLNGNQNIHWISIDEIMRSTVKGWMLSPGHRKNILTTTYESEGIGIAIADDGKVYITQNFF